MADQLALRYEALYSYDANDSTEVSMVEGDMVTFVPRDDTSPGWIMVRVADGAEGWVPESYVRQVTGEASFVDANEGKAEETGQIIPREEEQQSVSSEIQCK